MITLIDKDTQYIKFRVGTDLQKTTREDAFCNHVIEQKDVMIVPDTSLDERFINNPLVTDGPNIRFYAGSPLTTQDGHSLGSLCVIGREAKQLTSAQERMLKILSEQVIHILEFDFTLNLLKDQFSEAKNSEIKLRSFFESSSSAIYLSEKNLKCCILIKL